MAIERKYTITCDQCGHQANEKGEHYNHEWWDIYRDCAVVDGEFQSEEFDLCSDECAAAFDPREHRSHV